MAKLKAADMKSAFATLLCRNAIIITLYNILYSYSNLMKNATRNFIAAGDVGVSATYVTLLISIFSFAGFVFRIPFGALIDRHRGMLKKILIAANFYRAFAYIGFIVAGSQASLTLVYILDAVAFCFCGIAGPAVIGISVDKKAMGSAFAIYTGLTTVLTGTAKSVAVSLYNNYGRGTTMTVVITITIVSAFVLFLLDGNALSDSLRKEIAAKKARGIDVEKNKRKGVAGLLDGFCVAAIPFAICAGLAGVSNQNVNTYVNLYGVAAGYDYLGMQSIATTMSGVITLCVGFLCDFLPPSIFVVIALIAQITGAYLLFTCESNMAFNVAVFLVFAFVFVVNTLKISGMKRVESSQQGALAATIILFMDIFIMVGTIPAGMLIDAHGGAYNWAFVSNLVTSGGALVFWLLYVLFSRKKTRAAGERLPAKE